MVGAVPGRAYEAAGVAGVERGGRIVFQPLEGRTDVVAQGFEPGPRARLAVFDQRHVHAEFPRLLPSLRAKRSNPSCGAEGLDCFVTSFLAMTVMNTYPCGPK